MENSLCSVQDYENHALKVLPKSVSDYYRSGACEQITLGENRIAFKRLRIRPRVLIDISKIDTCTEVLECKLKIPFGTSPSAMQKMAHPDGEIGNARAIGSFGGVYILSTMSTTSIENVAAGAPDTIKWFQLYVYKDRNLAVQMVKRAENAGYKALVLTVDANVFGQRYDDIRNGFQLPPHLKLANLEDDNSDLNQINQQTGQKTSALNTYTAKLFDESISWDDVKWLKSITNLPIILKGILTAEDALIAVNLGVEGIIVSNHGGRQLDTSPASIEALPEISKAVGDRITVMFDGGIRYGTDIFKALALGAKLVFVGRPVLWGLAHSGEQGVKNVLKILNDEFRTTLGLAGISNLLRTPDFKRNFPNLIQMIQTKVEY